MRPLSRPLPDERLARFERLGRARRGGLAEGGRKLAGHFARLLGDGDHRTDRGQRRRVADVSYTHLKLPTIYPV